MQVITPQDVLSIEEYERLREAYRAKIIELKRRRRIAVGPLITLVFENRETLKFQIQEMIRVERIVDTTKVQDELDVYNALLPTTDELSATLLIEITDEAKTKECLDRFMGLDHGQKIAIVAGGERAFGIFESGHSHDTKISAVHFIRFRPTAGMRMAFADLRQPVLLTVDHGEYHAQTTVPGSMREEWLADLAEF
jgi:hypothetical protein